MKNILFIAIVIFTSLTCQAQETTRVFIKPGEQEKLIIDSLTNCLSENSSNALAYATRGEIVYQLNVNYPKQKFINISNIEALRDINKAIDIEPNNPNFHKIHSDYFFYVLDDFDSAIIAITKSISSDTLNPTWYNRRGFLKAKSRKWDEACEDWKYGATLKGDDAEVCKIFWDRNCK